MIDILSHLLSSTINKYFEHWVDSFSSVLMGTVLLGQGLGIAQGIGSFCSIHLEGKAVDWVYVILLPIPVSLFNSD